MSEASAAGLPGMEIAVSPLPSAGIAAANARACSARATHGDAPLDRITDEEYVKLVQHVFLAAENPPRVVVFAGVDPGNGCSRVCKRAAEVLASVASGTVCLVDADFNSPSARPGGRAAYLSGLAGALAHGGAIRTDVHQAQTGNLWILAQGSAAAGAGAAADPDVVRKGLQAFRREFDRILIDAPPLNVYADAVALGQLADGLVLVVEADATRRETAREVTGSLRRAGVKLLGAVLNKRTFPIPERLYRRL